MTDAVDIFEHDSLEGQAADSIRLVTLEPGLEHDLVKCTLHVACQSDKPEYSALSYAWGRPTRDERIMVNGKRFFVTKNLCAFLRRLRDTQVQIRVWVDAICINQDNQSERGHQVGLMGGIYRDAQVVYSWLGEDTHDVAAYLLARNMMQPTTVAESMTLYNASIQKPTLRKIRWPKSMVSKYRHQQTLTKTHFVKVPPTKMTEASALNLLRRLDTWVTLADLCRRAYFRRTWIVQEVLLAREVFLCVGSCQIPWTNFSAFIKACDHISKALGEINATHASIKGLDRFWDTIPVSEYCKFGDGPRITDAECSRAIFRIYQSSAVEFVRAKEGYYRRTISSLLSRYQFQECSDARDRIYAVLALADNCDNVEPDYSKSRVALFYDMKELVSDHALLRKCLELEVDEIRYRAEMLGLGFYEYGDNICIYPDPNNPNYSRERQRRRVEIERDFDFTISPGRVGAASSEQNEAPPLYIP